jgi:repressor LexA
MNDLKHLHALQRYYKRHRGFPAMAKLCEVVGMSSSASVFDLVSRLTENGYLQRLDGRVVPGPRFFARPVLGPVRAGRPQETSQEEPEYLNLDDYLIDEPDRTTLHRVRGDSMKDAGLLEGDLVVVEQHTPPKVGDIVLAVVEDGLTVKTLAQDAAGDYYLEAANPAYEPIRAKNSLEVLGVVVSVARRVRR